MHMHKHFIRECQGIVIIQKYWQHGNDYGKHTQRESSMGEDPAIITETLLPRILNHRVLHHEGLPPTEGDKILDELH